MDISNSKKNLDQNTAALELQAEELKKSVEQHKELVKATREQVKADKESLKIEQERYRRVAHPVFSIAQAARVRKVAGDATYNIIIKNNGPPASDIAISTEPEISQVKQRGIVPYVPTGGGFVRG